MADSPPDDETDETPSDDADGGDDESHDEPTSDRGDTKYCVACGEEISKDADVCPECGVGQHKLPESAGPGRGAHEKYCHNCGELISRDAEVCPECGADQEIGGEGEKDRVVAALLAILLGGIGAHKFYLGDTKLGVIYLCFFWTAIPALLGLIEGIIYLTEDDAEFERKHVKD